MHPEDRELGAEAPKIPPVQHVMRRRRIYSLLGFIPIIGMMEEITVYEDPDWHRNAHERPE